MDDLYAMTKKGLNPTIKSLILEINFKWVRLAKCVYVFLSQRSMWMRGNYGKQLVCYNLWKMIMKCCIMSCKFRRISVFFSCNVNNTGLIEFVLIFVRRKFFRLSKLLDFSDFEYLGIQWSSSLFQIKVNFWIICPCFYSYK